MALETKVAVMQPYFLPYLGYFSLIHSVDKFIFFDDVQFNKKSWMCRNQVLNPTTGKSFYFRPGIEHTNYQCKLKEVELSYSSEWRDTILNQLKCYKKSPFFRETFMLVEEILNGDFKTLTEFNISSTILISNYLGIKSVFMNFSDFDFPENNKCGPGDWGREIAKLAEANSYINAPGGEEFIFADKFTAENMKLGFIQPQIETYKQTDFPFISHLSILDVLFFNGKERTSKLVQNYSIKWAN
ncbi:MAG: WbqC family protein [Bacteroidetes bacterium]|nr:WbqC family protein [Bacteroidota bacterium]